MSHGQKMSLEKSVHRKTVGSATQGHMKFRGAGAVLTLCWLSLDPQHVAFGCCCAVQNRERAPRVPKATQPGRG